MRYRKNHGAQVVGDYLRQVLQETKMNDERIKNHSGNCKPFNEACPQEVACLSCWTSLHKLNMLFSPSEA